MQRAFKILHKNTAAFQKLHHTLATQKRGLGCGDVSVGKLGFSQQ